MPDLASRYVHLCGPVSLMEAVKKELTELGVPPDRVKSEAFGPALGKPEPAAVEKLRPPGRVRWRFPPSRSRGRTRRPRSRRTRQCLRSADEVGVEIDNSCRVGTCGVCRVKLLSGTVTMAVEDGLEPGDKEKNIILACQAKATGDVTVEA